MNEYEKRVLHARKEFIALNFQQEKELFNIYKNAGDKLIDEILSMPDSRTRNHKTEQYKIINEYRAELYYKLSKTIENNIRKSSDIQKGVQLSFVDMISPDEATNKALKRTITKVSSDTVRQLIAGNYYKDGKTLSRRLWNITGDNGSKVDMIIKANIAKGANVKELAAELDKYVNPKNRITAKSFKAGITNKISYQAQRLARTSITHAQTETLIQNAIKNPFCKGLKWNLSASHFLRMHGKTDICDFYDGKVFKPENLPLQHPNCLCYMTEVIEEIDKCIETMKDWSKDKVSPEIKSNIDEWVDSKKYPGIQTKSNYNTDTGTIDIEVREGKSTVDSDELEKIQNYKPPLAKRHRLQSIGRNSNPKDKTTIILPYVDYNKDIEDIKKGLYNKVNDTFEVNGRVYGYHGDRFYPISGDGFITLDRNEYKILIKMKTESKNPRLREFLMRMGTTEEIIQKISNILKAGEGNDG
ncbi:hypothetical protein [Clostridium kluyveri]|uniref:Phage head morphogenesis domain-containing protein n=2 Tax=Clostridium kluyveri TaxID=1534 RepID=A5N2D5_CLOK5|nr:hypothetical protein [Clostridium kluyveri]EDK35281.1 Conserved hypothetical protein [Clostridium kluyveri DSM 555]BAH07948.1 hypothetical protein CKR_2897 [Clostridium kluyveri NBRC 12016]